MIVWHQPKKTTGTVVMEIDTAQLHVLETAFMARGPSVYDV